MNSEHVVLIVMDEKENFDSDNTQLRIGKTLWQEIKLVTDREEFDKAYNELESEQEFVFACHLFHAKSNNGEALRGYYNLLNTKIERDYGITAHLVSSGDSGDVMKNLYETERVTRTVTLYSTLRDSVNLGNIKTDKKMELKNPEEINLSTSDIKHNYDIGIITALYQDEFDQIEDLFEWTGEHSTGRKIYRLGYPKSDPTKKVVAAFQTATGPVDAAVIASQMAEIFKPKYILMPGVCGGDTETNIGDIVVANKVFMFQKGKLSDVKNQHKDLMQLFNDKGEKIDLENLRDENGKQVILSYEKFEVEHSSISEIDSVLMDRLHPVIASIQDKINKEIKPLVAGKSVKIHFEPLACSTMVINKDGYFEKNVKPIDRKVIALEMESYGIARACQFANEGNTKFLIFKSVMDNMKDKDDHGKTFAGKTSSLFLKYLLETKIL